MTMPHKTQSNNDLGNTRCVIDMTQRLEILAVVLTYVCAIHGGRGLFLCCGEMLFRASRKYDKYRPTILKTSTSEEQIITHGSYDRDVFKD
jgi:hypothetical protein